MAHLIHTIPVLLSRPSAEIIAASAEVGRNAGYDSDWVPDDFDEAVWEIILSAGGPAEAAALGVIVRPDLDREADRKEIFRVVVELDATEEIEETIHGARHIRPRGWPETFEASVTAVLMAPDAPLEFGIEILNLAKPAFASNHARLAESRAISASLTRGQAGAGT